MRRNKPAVGIFGISAGKLSFVVKLYADVGLFFGVKVDDGLILDGKIFFVQVLDGDLFGIVPARNAFVHHIIGTFCRIACQNRNCHVARKIVKVKFILGNAESIKNFAVGNHKLGVVCYAKSQIFLFAGKLKKHILALFVLTKGDNLAFFYILPFASAKQDKTKNKG